MPNILEALGLVMETDRRPYCLRFMNFHPRVLAATAQLFDAHPYRQNDEDKQILFEMWLAAASEVYDVPAPVLSIVPPEQCGGAGMYTPATEAEPELPATVATILLPKYSVITLFHEYRHHLQHVHLHQETPDEPDARGWSASLFFTVRPKLFLHAAREGKIFYT